MTTGNIRTLDAIHVALERLGYTGERFGVAGCGPILFGDYRQSDGTVTVTWRPGTDLYEISASMPSVALLVYDAITRAGVACERTGARIDVHGQEHIDAEVRKLFE